MTEKNIVIKIADRFGGRIKLAEKLGVKPQAITPWILAEGFPPGRAIQIEQITQGKVKAVNIVQK